MPRTVTDIVQKVCWRKDGTAKVYEYARHRTTTRAQILSPDDVEDFIARVADGESTKQRE